MTFHHPPGRIPTAADIVQAGHRGDADLIEWAADSDDAPLRVASIGALLRTGALDAERLRDFGADAEPSVRRRAAEVAPRVPGAPGTEAMLVGMLDDQPEIAEMAAFALGEVGSSDGAALRPDTIERLESMAIDHEDALCREAAVASLGALHTGLETILAACTDKATVRRRAVIALAPFDGPEVEAALHTALTDRDWQVRQAAEDQIGPPADDAISDESDSS